jgi:tripartite-type tricarboxylate transporter receptor subunit TctC
MPGLVPGIRAFLPFLAKPGWMAGTSPAMTNDRESAMSKLALLLSILAPCVTATATSTHAAPYPTHTVEIIVSYGAGGSTDFVARAVAQKLTEKLGQPFVILNRPGASGTIGIKNAIAAKPDGYTLYVGYTSETVVVPQISKTANYSVLDDFEPIAVTGLVPVVLIVSKDMHVDNLKDFIAEVRANPGKYTYGGSIGSPPHVMGAWMNKIRGLQVQHIPYRGGAQGVTDVIGGHLDMFYGGVAVAKPAIDGGNVKALAVTGDTRSTALPNVPTFKEAGVPEFDLASWTVMLAPKGTPPDIVALIRKETLAALDDPATKSALARQGVERSDNQDVRAFLIAEREKFGRAVRELGIKMGE